MKKIYVATYHNKLIDTTFGEDNNDKMILYIENEVLHNVLNGDTALFFERLSDQADVMEYQAVENDLSDHLSDNQELLLVIHDNHKDNLIHLLQAHIDGVEIIDLSPDGDINVNYIFIFRCIPIRESENMNWSFLSFTPLDEFRNERVASPKKDFKIN